MAIIKRSTRRVQAGFTLLELLVVLGILAFLGAVGFRMATSSIRLQQTIDQQTQAMETMVRVWQWLERDIEQWVNRPVREALGESESALSLTANRLHFTKSGWQNPLGYVRSDLQRVEYQWSDEGLIRRHWAVLDRDAQTPMIEQRFDSVVLVSVQLLSESGWQSQWPNALTALPGVQEPANAWPLAVKVRISMPGFGEIERLFRPVQWPQSTRETEE